MRDALALHITNGDSAAAMIEHLVAPAPVLPWRDMLHDGPVPAGLSLDALSAVRAQFLASSFGLADDIPAQFRARDSRLREALQSGAACVLWFEHDLYDQLQLVQVLAWLAAEDIPPARIALIQSDRHLTSLSPVAIGGLVPRQVTAAQLALAAAVWAAFRAPTPEPLAGWLAQDPGALPWLAQAMARLLEELPAPSTGLSRTERLILEALTAGPCSAGHLFARTNAADEPHFLGDWPFFVRLDALAAEPAPLVAGLPGPCPFGRAAAMRAYVDASLKLTPAGAAALAGRLDRASAQPLDRWLGGTHLTRECLWRWEPARRVLTAG